MKVLVINCGSSTLKFQLLELMEDGSAVDQPRRLAHGLVDKIGSHGAVEITSESGERLEQVTTVADHGEATRCVLAWLDTTDVLETSGLTAVGHRVVHGGDRFVEPARIDDEAVSAIEALIHLAPLHNGPALQAIRACRTHLAPSVAMVAVFDTAFHSTLPDRASLYAIPYELADKYHVRRYGFHGIAHRHMTERYAAINSMRTEQVKLITLQLGNGCSVTAVDGGKSVDTSMGFTPLEGLVMGTRSGDVDPSLAGFLARQEGVSSEDVEEWLNTRSGLLGLSGRSGDMRELLETEGRGDPRAALAVEMFCYRARKYVGAYLAALGGADAIVFGGGIGEHAPAVRARICEGLDWFGLTVDPARNAAAVGREARINSDDSTLGAFVIPVNEEEIIARETARWVLRQRQNGDS